MNPFFSVIIPAYNAANTIQKTLESLQKQTFKNFEVIVVDDGSTDKTKEIVEQHSTVKYIYQNNAGPRKVINNGSKYALCEYLIFLDADDIIFEWGLSVYFNQIQVQKTVSFFGGQILEFSSDEQLKTIKEIKVDTITTDCYFTAAQQGVFVGSGM